MMPRPGVACHVLDSPHCRNPRPRSAKGRESPAARRGRQGERGGRKGRKERRERGCRRGSVAMQEQQQISRAGKGDWGEASTIQGDTADLVRGCARVPGRRRQSVAAPAGDSPCVADVPGGRGGKLTMLASASRDSWPGMPPSFCMRDVDASRLPPASRRRRRTAVPPATRLVARIPFYFRVAGSAEFLQRLRNRASGFFSRFLGLPKRFCFRLLIGFHPLTFSKGGRGRRSGQRCKVRP